MEGSALGRRAWRLVLLLGLVSLFGDITYEGVRGVTGPYLALLGASATVVGLVAGLGEFLGYALRMVTGYAADRFRSYWPLTILGYVLVGALPLLALTQRWETAAFLIVLERLGKALRTPSREAILSHATSRIGRGRGFAVHEALDQAGALIGPLLFALALTVDGLAGYRLGFALLAIPAILLVILLLLSWRMEPRPERLERPVDMPVARAGARRLTGAFWRYSIFSGVAMLGFAHFALLSYHFERTGIVSAPVIPLLYAVAMGIDGLAALVAGWMYDRHGLLTLVALPVCAVLAVLGAFQANVPAIVIGVLCWGIAMGLVETNMRAAVGDLSDPDARGLAYGVFNTIFGLSWLLGGVLLGALYERLSTGSVIIAVGVLEGIALLSFWGLGVTAAHRGQRTIIAR
ncbi:MAG: MFS transporter [Thermomicrobium sp.]|nr:MFS transporter [Thermomicrobium sp.]